jgi:REP element-mobilizing transposase RayT
MKYDPKIHHRRSIRLKGHDYAGGGEYFVTLCAHRDAGKVFDPPAVREILKQEWRKCGEVRDDVFPGEYAIMPDHFHGLIRIVPGQSELGRVVGAFKAAVSRRIRKERATCAPPLRTGDTHVALSHVALSQIRIWHRNYYERIIRNAEDRERTEKYIRLNPVKLQFRIDGMSSMGNPALWELPTLGILASGKGMPAAGLRIPPKMVLLSGCHSGIEEQIARESDRPLIWMPAVEPGSVGFAGWQLKRLEAGTLLVVCPFAETRTTRENALKRNRIIAERCDQLWIPAARPGGTLEQLKKEF